MSARPAAKGILTFEGERLIMVAGKSGRWSLPGGGINIGETVHQAFLRELEEELGLKACDLQGITKPFEVEGPTSSANGTEGFSQWKVIRAEVCISANEINIPYGDAIHAVAILTPDKCLELPNLSNLARTAILAL